MKAGSLIAFSIFTLAFVGHGTQSFSQDTLQRSISVAIGYGHYRLMDVAFAHERVKYTGGVFDIGLRYLRTYGKHYVSARIGVAPSRVSPPDQRPGAHFTNVHISGLYARRVLDYKLMRSHSVLFGGLQIASDNYVIENVDEYDEATITANHTVGLVVVQQMRISSRSKLELSVLLPVAGFTKRANYDGGINQQLEEDYDRSIFYPLVHGARFRSINPVTLPTIAMAFGRRVSPRTDMVIGYRFAYLENTSIAPIRLYGNTLNVCLRFNFNKAL